MTRPHRNLSSRCSSESSSLQDLFRAAAGDDVHQSVDDIRKMFETLEKPQVPVKVLRTEPGCAVCILLSLNKGFRFSELNLFIFNSTKSGCS